MTLAEVGATVAEAHEALPSDVLARDFDAFYAATNGTLLGQLYVMCGDMEEARDCLQEAYIRAWQRWRVVSACDSPAAWVRNVAWRLAISRWHRARNGLRAMTQSHQSPVMAGPTGDDIDLARALRRLPAAQREAIVLHHLLGMSVEEIAAEIGAPSGTVKARLSRGRGQLAEYLSDKEVTL